MLTSLTFLGIWPSSRQKNSVAIIKLQLPRQRKLPRRYDNGSASGHSPSTPKAHFKPVYQPHSFQFLCIMLSGERVGVVTQLYLSRGSGPAANRLVRDNKLFYRFDCFEIQSSARLTNEGATVYRKVSTSQS